ncbi:MAG: zf-HC2 domain-containing protein [Candidatus Binataceae bacterium]|jgi:anti-sigma factor RsiW
MANCSEIAPLLGCFEDSELDPHEMQEVARHLAQCDACEAALNEFESIGNHLRAVAIQPPMANFVTNVQRRIDKASVPLPVRIRLSLDRLSERWAAALALPTAALALGAWVLLFAPYAQRYLQRGPEPSVVANTQGPAEISRPQDANQVATGQGPSEGVDPEAQEVASGAPPMGDSPQTVISRLEARTPNVAVWSEPETKTTVIWMPDAP